MTPSVRLFVRISVLLSVVILLTAGFFFAWFASWRADRLASLNSASDLVKTPRGLVEVVIRGEGPAVLIFHGATGGYDRAMLLGSAFTDDHLHIVAPSRPGYLRTPLSTGVTPEEQADTMASLLDEVGISSVAVLANSCGAPAAVQFALRYPQKTWAMVLISARAGQFDPQGERIEPGRLILETLKGDLGAFACFEAAEKDPRQVLSWIIDAGNSGNSAEREALIDYVLNDPDQLDWFRSLIATFTPLSAREAGLRNDLVQLRLVKDMPFEAIITPTLVVHGTADKCVGFGEAEALARRIPGAILYPVPGAGHLVEIGPLAAEVQKKIGEFLRQHAAEQSLH